MKKDFMNREDMYKFLFNVTKLESLINGFSEDKANRKANLFAVKNTNKCFLNQVKDEQ